jgi:protoporphyrinogen oxidase
MKIAIIGAGMGGLSAAYELTKKGHRVAVFEQASEPGGLGGYLKIGQTYIERYYHHFFQSDTEILRLANELNLSDKLKFYFAKTGTYIDGKLFPFNSIGALLAYTPLSLANRIRCGLTMAFLKFLPIALPTLDKISAADWIRRYAGQQVYDKVWGPLLDGKFSQFAKTIPALWLWGRVHDRSLKLGYFNGSVKVLFDAMIEKIETAGGQICYNTPVEQIEPAKTGVVIAVNGETWSFDGCVVSTLSPTVARMLGAHIAPELSKKLTQIDHLGAVCLILELSRPVQSQYWVNISEKGSPVLVMVEHTNMLPPRDYGGKSIVYLANYIHRNDPRSILSDEEVFQTYSAILQKLNPLFDKSWVVSWHVSRIPRAQTIFATGSLQTIPPIEIIPGRVYMINIDQMYPHDRNLHQAAYLGRHVACMIHRQRSIS